VDVELCVVFDDSPCFCACHKADRRPVSEIEADLREGLKGLATVRTDRAENPQGPSFFMVTSPNSEIVVEYEPKEGFGLTLVGFVEDEDRSYQIGFVLKKIIYWLEGNV
jgi:hypothetical protein